MSVRKVPLTRENLQKLDEGWKSSTSSSHSVLSNKTICIQLNGDVKSVASSSKASSEGRNTLIISFRKKVGRTVAKHLSEAEFTESLKYFKRIDEPASIMALHRGDYIKYMRIFPDRIEYRHGGYVLVVKSNLIILGNSPYSDMKVRMKELGSKLKKNYYTWPLFLKPIDRGTGKKGEVLIFRKYYVEELYDKCQNYIEKNRKLRQELSKKNIK